MKRLLWSKTPDSSPGPRITVLTALSAIGVFMASLVFAGGALLAQQAEQLVASVHGVPSQGQNIPAKDRKLQQVLEIPLALDLSNVALSAALDEVAKQSGVRITYSRTVVPFDRRVSVRGERVTLGDALNAILAGTNAVPQLTPDKQITIARSQKPAVSSGSIVGRVIHAKTKQPVAGATVSVRDSDAKVVTGNDGRFNLNAPAGDQTIEVRAVGFIRQAKSVTVGDGVQVSVEIALEPSASVLDEVIVTGTVVATERKAIPNPITVITAEEIERRGITRIDQLLRGQVPGVIALEKGTFSYNGGYPGWTRDDLSSTGDMMSSNVYTRGASTFNSSSNGDAAAAANPLKTYVDGVELVDPSYLGSIDPQSIERIEIITGPQAATVYGSGAMGGVMQIFTKKGSGRTTPDITVRLKYGMLQNSIADGLTPAHHHTIGISGGSGPQLSYTGNLSYVYQGQWQPKLFNRTFSGTVGATHTTGSLTIAAAFSSMSGRNGSLSSGWPITYLEKAITGEWTITVPKGEFYDQRVSENSVQTYSFNADHQITSTLQHHLTLGRSMTAFANISNTPRYGTSSDSLFTTTTNAGTRTSMSYNATYSPSISTFLSSTLTAGFSATNMHSVFNGGCLATNSSTSYVPCGTASVYRVAIRDADSEERGGFGSFRVGMWDKFFLTLGLRAEYNPAYGSENAINWTPTNGLTYVFEHGNLTIKLLGSYGQATRAPLPDQKRELLSSINTSYDPPQYVSQFANNLLGPESASGPQGGVEIYYGSLGSLTINRYRQVVHDLIQSVAMDTITRIYLPSNYVQKSSQNQYVNVGEILQQGWEGTATVSLGVLSLKGTYSWNDSRVKTSKVSSIVPGAAFPGIPTHTGHLQANIAYGASAVTFVTNYIGALSIRWTNRILERNYFFSRDEAYDDYAARHIPLTYYSKPGYVKSDLIATHRLNSWVTAELNMTNVGNSYRADFKDSFPSLGRQTMLGLNFRYPGR